MRKHLLISAFVIVSLGALAIPSTADARGSHVRKVRLQDRCDPASFNAAFGPPDVCVPHGGKLVTVDKFLAKLNPEDFGHEDWNNHPDELDLKSGDSISVTVRGGELHTFTEVDAFGAGCFLPINDALGLTDPPSPAKCAEYFATTGVAANGASTLTVSGLSVGTHLFMCEIHPWMTTTVTVEGDHEHDDDD
jgi:plastocyanin